MLSMPSIQTLKLKIREMEIAFEKSLGEFLPQTPLIPLPLTIPATLFLPHSLLNHYPLTTHSLPTHYPSHYPLTTLLNTPLTTHSLPTHYPASEKQTIAALRTSASVSTCEKQKLEEKVASYARTIAGLQEIQEWNIVLIKHLLSTNQVLAHYLLKID